MRPWRLKNMLLIPLLAALGACQVFPISIAPATRPLEPGEFTELGPIDASSTGAYLLFFPLTSRSSIDDAIEKALRDTNADALINVTADVTMFYLIVVNVITTRVYGDAVKVN